MSVIDNVIKNIMGKSVKKNKHEKLVSDMFNFNIGHPEKIISDVLSHNAISAGAGTLGSSVTKVVAPTRSSSTPPKVTVIGGGDLRGQSYKEMRPLPKPTPRPVSPRPPPPVPQLPGFSPRPPLPPVYRPVPQLPGKAPVPPVYRPVPQLPTQYRQPPVPTQVVKTVTESSPANLYPIPYVPKVQPGTYQTRYMGHGVPPETVKKFGYNPNTDLRASSYSQQRGYALPSQPLYYDTERMIPKTFSIPSPIFRGGRNWTPEQQQQFSVFKQIYEQQNRTGPVVPQPWQVTPEMMQQLRGSVYPNRVFAERGVYLSDINPETGVLRGTATQRMI